MADKLGGPGNPEWQAFRAAATSAALKDAAAFDAIYAEMMKPGRRLPFSSAKPRDSVVVLEKVEIPMRDGVILRATVCLPSSEGRFPAILHRGPYDESSALDWTPLLIRELAARGYAAISQDVRGRYSSDGVFEAWAHEADDGFDTVQWIAAQPWSNGGVGMTGVSYPGWCCYAAASRRPPALRCILPAMVGCDSLLAAAPNTVQLELAAWWLIYAQPRRTLENPRLVDLTHLPVSEIPAKAGLRHPEFDRMLSCRNNVDTPLVSSADSVRAADVAVPVLVAAGWYDELLVSSLKTWHQLSDASLIIGPWQHQVLEEEEQRIGSLPTPDLPLAFLYKHMEAFFDAHLKGEPDTSAPTKVFIYVMGANIWRAEPEWPLSRARSTAFFLDVPSGGNEGSLDLAGPTANHGSSTFVYDPADLSRCSLTTSIYTATSTMQSYPNPHGLADRVAFISAPLTAEIEVTGTPRLNFYAGSTAETTDFVARLIDVHPNNHRQYLTHGILRTSYRESSADPMLLSSGSVYEFVIDLQPTSNAFAVGHRIELEISSIDFPRYVRNLNVHDPDHRSAKSLVATQTIFHSAKHPSQLILPVIPS